MRPAPSLVPEPTQPPIRCGDCQSALREGDSVSFLLLDQFRVPLVGCRDHLERFRAICGLTSEETATLLPHRPAGGISCPGCRFAPQRPGHTMVPVDGGATLILACPRHQSALASRFQHGLETQKQLTADVGSV